MVSPMLNGQIETLSASAVIPAAAATLRSPSGSMNVIMGNPCGWGLRDFHYVHLDSPSLPAAGAMVLEGFDLFNLMADITIRSCDAVRAKRDVQVKGIA